MISINFIRPCWYYSIGKNLLAAEQAWKNIGISKKKVLVKQMNSTDVAIIGAGPAGSIAAQRLAKEGVRVALIDRASFPRDKSCGDGVGSRGLDVLERSGLGEWAGQFLAPQVLTMSPPDGTLLTLYPDVENHCFGRTIPRMLLDDALVQSAVKAGASLHENTRVEGVEIEEQGVQVHSNGTRFSARMLILADGSHAPITRKLGLIQDRPDLYAIRQYVQGDADSKKTIEFHFQPWIIPGYTWIFPMNDSRANIGTGTFTYRLKQNVDLRDFLARFLTEQRANGGRLANSQEDGVVKGHPLRTRLGNSHLYAKNTLVIGDAAGLVNPLSGEGISSGMESGEMAAKHILAMLKDGGFSQPHYEAYRREVLATFLPDWRAARFFRQVLKSPWLLNRVFRKMSKDHERALHFVYLLLNYLPQRDFLKPGMLLKLLG